MKIITWCVQITCDGRRKRSYLFGKQILFTSNGRLGWKRFLSFLFNDELAHYSLARSLLRQIYVNLHLMELVFSSFFFFFLFLVRISIHLVFGISIVVCGFFSNYFSSSISFAHLDCFEHAAPQPAKGIATTSAIQSFIFFLHFFFFLLLLLVVWFVNLFFLICFGHSNATYPIFSATVWRKRRQALHVFFLVFFFSFFAGTNFFHSVMFWLCGAAQTVEWIEWRNE